jgi:general secretion pathway protein N
MTRPMVVIAAVCLLAAFVVSLPARWVDAGLAHVSRDTLRVALAEGSVWRGRGQLVRLGDAGRAIPGEKLAWAFQPARLKAWQLVWRVSQGERDYLLAYRNGSWEALGEADTAAGGS